MQRLLIIFGLSLVINSKTVGQLSKEHGVLIQTSDSVTGSCGYKSESGKIVIPMGKYQFCFTDTFRNYAIVLDSAKGFVAIDRKDRVLYNVFVFDNGPDYPSEGLFRITTGGKIGYADLATGKIAIKPQFACAWPFENGMAKVSQNCETRSEGEHHIWISDQWFYINKTGARVTPLAK